MDNVIYFNNLFESIPDYRKFVLIRFLNKNDVNLIDECGYLRNYIYRLCLQFENFTRTK